MSEDAIRTQAVACPYQETAVFLTARLTPRCLARPDRRETPNDLAGADSEHSPRGYAAACLSGAAAAGDDDCEGKDANV